MWLRRERDRDGRVVPKKKGEMDLDSGQPKQTRMFASVASDFQDQLQLGPPERRFSRQGGFPTQLFPARRLMEVRVHSKRVQPAEWGRISDKSHQARLPPVRPRDHCSPSALWEHTDPFMMLHGNGLECIRSGQRNHCSPRKEPNPCSLGCWPGAAPREVPPGRRL